MVKAKEKLKTVLDAYRNKEGISAVEYYKAGLRAMHVEELRKEKGKEFALLEDKELSTLEKLAILRDLQAELYKKEGYEGTLPGLYVTDGPNSFAVDGKDGKGKRIFISVQDLESGKGLASLYAHENVHLYSGYEKGEHLAEYGEAKVSKESSKERFTEEERRAYLEKVKGRIDQAESLEKQFSMAKEVSEEDRENHTIEYFASLGGSKHFFGFARASITGSHYISFDRKNDKAIEYTGTTKSFGLGSNDFGGSVGIGLYLADTLEEVRELDKSYGRSISLGKFSFGLDILSKGVSNEFTLSDFFHPKGIRIYMGVSTSKQEIHASMIDFGSIKVKSEKSILEHWKEKWIPTSARQYYINDHESKE